MDNLNTNIIDIINKTLDKTGIIPGILTLSPYEYNSAKFEVDDCFYHYIVNINEFNSVALYEVLQFIKRFNIICSLNLKIDEIKESNRCLVDLLKLTSQHKQIYESGREIYDSFIEQAGTYDSVMKSYNLYLEQYEQKVLTPIAEINKKIEEINKINNINKNTFRINTELEMSLFDRPTVNINI